MRDAVDCRSRIDAENRPVVEEIRRAERSDEERPDV